jgi:hypothetical protein
MKRLPRCLIAVIALTFINNATLAQELLTNPSLTVPFGQDSHLYTTAPGWETDEGPPVARFVTVRGDYSGNSWVDTADYVAWRKLNGTPGPLLNEVVTLGAVNDLDRQYWQIHYGDPGPLSLSEPSNYTHHPWCQACDTDLDNIWQHWFQPYSGTFANAPDNYAHLMQTVEGTPGLEYTMSGYAMFEDYFPGGVTNLNAEIPGNPPTPSGVPYNDGPVSPTNSYFALDFLDTNGDILPGSLEKELKDELGQLSNHLYQQHFLAAVAPPGTTHVRVRVTMTDGVINPLPGNDSFLQSFFVDGFSLTAAVPGGGGAVPEPTSCALIGLAASWFAMYRRRFRTR